MPDQPHSRSIHLTRRANLLLLLREFSASHLASGVPAKGIEGLFAEHLQISPSTLSQLKSSRNISDKNAAQIEVLAGKTQGWLSVDQEQEAVTPAQRAFEALAVKAWHEGNAKERRRLMQLAKTGFALIPSLGPCIS